ncbi:hypothetical protein T552_00850 [Pneumocystis carinii B80]|uniref:Uncharacterized protein n=1 Tax=Pneumocystis carinii (strain B80) TaxID=1408658 RepID=A0A0W4ZPT1_PNEC8|nr:hypothetical protein T552_00850 [Pneumocystis carinii B80]KTW30377.1 hypothetical protein T552_00850 [Pneumocystis carinii B80]
MNIHRCRFVDYNSSSITSICFSHDSFTLNSTPKSLRCAVGRANGDLEIWNPQKHWTHEITLRGGINRSIEGISWVTTQYFSRLFTIGYSTVITEWDLKKLAPLNHLNVNSGSIWSISASPSKDKLVVGCDNGNLVIVNISSAKGNMEYVCTLTNQNCKIFSLSWNNVHHIIAGCSDSSIRVWDSCDTRCNIIAQMSVDKIGNEDTLVWAIKILECGIIVSGDSTGSVKFWDQKYYSLLQSFKSHTADVLCLASNRAGNILFSAGVDCKTIMYRIINKENQQWADVAGRRFHRHDVRAMALYESKDIDILVTGGVDMTLAIVPVMKFMKRVHRIILPVPQRPVMSFSDSRIMINWSDHQVKLWKINEIYLNSNDETSLICNSKNNYLLLKIRINTEENINVAAISKDGNYIAIATLFETKLFKLRYGSNFSDIKTKKLKVHSLESIGATDLLFDQRSNLIIAHLNKIYFLNLYSLESIATITKPEDDKTISTIEYSNIIKLIALSDDSKYLAVYSFSQDIYIYNLENFIMVSQLPQLSSPAATISFSSFTASLIVITVDNFIFDFDIKTGKLGDWSKKNSANLPTEFLRLKDNCIGISFDYYIKSRMWLWGSNWIGFVDLSLEMPKRKVNKRRLKDDRNSVHFVYKSLNGKHIIENSESQDEKEHSINSNNVTLDTVEKSIDIENKEKRKHFWITYKYRPLLLMGCLNEDEILIVERPLVDMLIDKGVPPPYYKHLYGT